MQLLLEVECMDDENEDRERERVEERKYRFRLIGRKKKKDTLLSKEKECIDQTR